MDFGVADRMQMDTQVERDRGGIADLPRFVTQLARVKPGHSARSARSDQAGGGRQATQRRPPALSSAALDRGALDRGAELRLRLNSSTARGVSPTATAPPADRGRPGGGARRALRRGGARLPFSDVCVARTDVRSPCVARRWPRVNVAAPEPEKCS